MRIVRLAFLVVVIAALSPGRRVAASQADRPELPAPDSFLGIATLPLWETGAPEALGKTPADTPTLTIFRPHFGTANGTAVIVAPGGAYLGLAANLEGRQVADWFAARGVTAFVLRYRLGSRYPYPVPLLDARRAIRLVRSRAAEFRIAPGRVGIMGFSAGGHLAATAATMFDDPRSDAADPAERVSSRPDFVVLGYPWLNAMKKDPRGPISYCSVLKIDPERCASFEQYSPDLHVSAQTPPTFIYHTTDDETVPVEASVAYYRALSAAGVSAEMHVFANGRHGSGLGLGDASLDLWPTLLEAWMRARGWLTPDPAVAAETRRILTPPAPRSPGTAFSVDLSIRDLLSDPRAKAIVEKHLGREYVAQIPDSAQPNSLRAMSLFDPDHVTATTLAAVETDLRKLPH
jgi:acetyl esterase/lipase